MPALVVPVESEPATPPATAPAQETSWQVEPSADREARAWFAANRDIPLTPAGEVTRVSSVIREPK